MTAPLHHTKRVLPASLLAAMVLALPSAAPASAATRCSGTDSVPGVATVDATRRTTLCLLNVERRKRGLSALRVNGALQSAAQAHSRDMVRRSFFEHTSPSGTTFSQRILRTGYAKGSRAYTLGENIAWGGGSFATPRSIVLGWMRSPGHRANILRRAFREIGIGIITGAPVPAPAGAVLQPVPAGGLLQPAPTGALLQPVLPTATYTTDFGARP